MNRIFSLVKLVFKTRAKFDIFAAVTLKHKVEIKVFILKTTGKGVSYRRINRTFNRISVEVRNSTIRRKIKEFVVPRHTLWKCQQEQCYCEYHLS